MGSVLQYTMSQGDFFQPMLTSYERTQAEIEGWILGCREKWRGTRVRSQEAQAVSVD
jgi:hypothetical protein